MDDTLYLSRLRCHHANTVALVPRIRDKRDVPDAFDEVASSYDLLTTLNPGYQAHLNESAGRMRMPPGARLLDLCCGTGRSTRALAEAYPDADIVAVDGSRAMLAAARRKPLSTRVDFLHGDAMNPVETAGVTPHFDGIFMAYGIRNVSDPDLCLQRLCALLRPGGTICFHEYSVADAARSRLIWNAVTLGVIIPMGMVTARRSPIYRYLRRSVLEFDGVTAFEKRLGRAGFVNVHTLPLGGWQRGIVHSFLATRPG